MKIFGLTDHEGRVHDSSIALVEDGKILFAEAEERVSRVKHDGRFPYLAIKEALKFTKTKISNIDYFVSATPKENYFRMFLTTLRFIPHVGIKNYLEQTLKALVYRKRKPFSDDVPRDIGNLKIPKDKFLIVSHYLAHAASAYYSCPFDKCLVINMDGFGLGEKGEPLSGGIYLGFDNKLSHVEDIPVHASLGLYYGIVTLAIGFKLNDGEGKTMGLAAYGNASSCYRQMKNFFPNFVAGKWKVRNSIMDILNVSKRDIFQNSRTNRYLSKLVDKYGRENVAASCQRVFEEELIKYISYLVNNYKLSKVVVAGGIFLNVKANLLLIQKKIVDELFVYPNPADGGTAVGAAYLGFLMKGKKIARKELLHPAFGREFSDKEIKRDLGSATGIVFEKIKKGLAKKVAILLTRGKVVGWFQGRGEWGPRALGQRSVIADPRKISTKDRINKILKGREWFMPFAPSMLAERAPDYLKTLRKAPFMIIADELKRGKAKDLKAAIHIDKTARPHLVTKQANPLYYQVIKEFEKLTGVGAILNTSFNKHGLPIVYTPKDAIKHLLWKTIDCLVIGSYYVIRDR